MIELLHSLNSFLHQEPFGSLIESLYWCFLLLVVCPVIACFQFLAATWSFFAYPLGLRNPRITPPSERKDEQLAVVVTGCDSGFGKEIVFELASNGFVVFCGCLNEESFQQYEGESLVIPIKMDVTKDEEVSEAYKTVQNWIESGGDDKNSVKKKRYLHALVNNAGIVVPGLIDWTKLSEYQKVMDVNFFGTIRCVKAFMPIFKSQASSKVNSDGTRIINMISGAGLMAPMPMCSAYGASKYATECFSSNLAQEMGQLFDAKVTTLNPSFHQTPMVGSMHDVVEAKWRSLSEETRKEYGEEFVQTILKNISLAVFAWKSHMVTNEVTRCLLLKDPPTKVILGTDSKFVYNPLSKLPPGLVAKYLPLGTGNPAFRK